MAIIMHEGFETTSTKQTLFWRLRRRLKRWWYIDRGWAIRKLGNGPNVGPYSTTMEIKYKK
jgi:hypothetical protein